VEAPGEINLDSDPLYLEQILDGSFLNFICPSCGKKHKPEFPLLVRWPDRKLTLEVLPEPDRGEFYRRKAAPDNIEETVIGYPELAERLAVHRDRLSPPVIEALKYHMLLKAEESWPDEEVNVWYQHQGPGGLEFHLHGFKNGTVAVSRIPGELYEKTLAEYERRPRGETFSALRFRSYVSVQNAMREN
jgi:hypothetical protein